MKPILFAAALGYLAFAVPVRAGIVTLDLTAGAVTGDPGAQCSPICTLGGDMVFKRRHGGH
jgi:hypothetical protein